MFISFGLRMIWQVHRFLETLYRMDEDAVPILQTKQTRDRCMPAYDDTNIKHYNYDFK